MSSTIRFIFSLLTKADNILSDKHCDFATNCLDFKLVISVTVTPSIADCHEDRYTAFCVGNRRIFRATTVESIVRWKNQIRLGEEKRLWRQIASIFKSDLYDLYGQCTMKCVIDSCKWQMIYCRWCRRVKRKHRAWMISLACLISNKTLRVFSSSRQRLEHRYYYIVIFPFCHKKTCIYHFHKLGKHVIIILTVAEAIIRH